MVSNAPSSVKALAQSDSSRMNRSNGAENKFGLMPGEGGRDIVVDGFLKLKETMERVVKESPECSG
jgi:hypothetical protein